MEVLTPVHDQADALNIVVLPSDILGEDLAALQSRPDVMRQ